MSGNFVLKNSVAEALRDEIVNQLLFRQFIFVFCSRFLCKFDENTVDNCNFLPYYAGLGL